MNLLETKIRCPACTTEFRLEQGISDKRIWEIAAYAAVFGGDWYLVESYLACFRTDTGRGVRPERLAVILKELSEIYKNRKMKFRGKEIVVHNPVLRQALTEIGQRSDTLCGFRDHNYLKKVLNSKMNQWHREREIEERKSIELDMRGGPRLQPGGSAEDEKSSTDGPGYKMFKETCRILGEKTKAIRGKAIPVAENEAQQRNEPPKMPSEERRKLILKQCEDLAAEQGIDLKKKAK